MLGVPPGKERRKRHLNAGLNTARVLPGVEVEMYLQRGHKPMEEERKTESPRAVGRSPKSTGNPKPGLSLAVASSIHPDILM